MTDVEGGPHVDPITRRAWLARAGQGLLLAIAGPLLRPHPVLALGPTPITVYKDPSCGCCKSWVTHLAREGFAPTAHDRHDMDALKDSLGVPPALRSCHTAVVGRYLIEGHVPASDIKTLLAARPANVHGLAVPGMPAGSPGMEMGGHIDRFEVIAFGPAGRTHVFARHG